MERDGSREDAGAAGAGDGDAVTGAGGGAKDGGLRVRLESALVEAGLDAGSVTVFADAALLAGAVGSGRAVTGVGTGFLPVSVPAVGEGMARQDSAQDDEQGGGEGGGVEGSVDAHCATADRAQVAVEAVNQVICRLEGVRVVAVGEGVVAMGRAELARAGVTDAGELSATGRERWRWRSKARVRQDLAPATGWTRGATAALVAVASAPVAFRAPVLSALARGTVSWPLVGGLWRACDRARLSAADAAHVAMVMLADDPDTCVPERLEPDGSITPAPWGQGAFWAALDREVTKLVACPDPGDEASVKAAAAAKAAREAAYRARSMWIRVNEDGTAQVGFTGSVLKVLALGDRLDKAARAARGAGDARTVTQLANDIGIALLGHAVIGAHELPDLDIFKTAQPTPQDLAAAGWTPQVIAALSSLPPAILQVVVPLLALHDPAQAHTLPGVARTTTTQDPNSDPTHDPAGDGAGDEADAGAGGVVGEEAEGPGQEHGQVDGADDDAGQGGEDVGHTGAAGCPACLPSARAARNHDLDHASRHDRQDCQDRQDRQDNSGHATAVRRGTGAHCAQDPGPGRGPRVVWVGRVLGKHPGFVGPDLVRRLALSPGSTFVRLLVDPADGRCLERSSTSYSFDAAMRAQLAAADLTCRAPGCEHHGGGCQVDHVTEHGTPGGHTREANGQLVDMWHHDPKTAKAWDAVLHANRDVTWTTTLSRVYRTRVHDYRELVTVIVDALERIAAVEPEDRMDQINLEVYQALCYRAAGERLNEGDDDTYEETHLTRFGGEITIGLSHRDPLTGRRTPGPSPAAQTRADTAAALSRTTPPQGSDATGTDQSDTMTPDGAEDERPARENPAGSDQQHPRRRHRPQNSDNTPWSRHHDDGPPPF